jgi:hypothetical protein
VALEIFLNHFARVTTANPFRLRYLLFANKFLR